jgi:hypothetical protein
MHQFNFMALALAATVALVVASNGPAGSTPDMGDLSALPGCSGQCHINGGFIVDRVTGQKKFPHPDPIQPICAKPRFQCGPLFCQSVQTCCVEGHCVNHNIGAPVPR